MRRAISVFSTSGVVICDIDDRRFVIDNVQQIVEIIQRRKKTKLYIHMPNLEAFVPVMKLVDVICTSDSHIDEIIKLGFGHKVCVFEVEEKYFGLIHPKSSFRFTTNPVIKRLVVRNNDQLQTLVGKELDYLFSSVGDEYSLEGIDTEYFKSIIGNPDIRPLLMCSRLKKFDISTTQAMHIDQVNCFDLESYRYTVSGISTEIPAIEEMMNNRRFAKVKVASH